MPPVKSRHLKVYPKYRKRLTLKDHLVPELRLIGDWLAQAGFAIGDQVEVKIEKNQLHIIKQRTTK